MGFLGLFSKKKKNNNNGVTSEPLEDQEESLVNTGAGVIKQKNVKVKKESGSGNHHHNKQVISNNSERKHDHHHHQQKQQITPQHITPQQKEGDEDVIPTIYCINGIKGLQKADRKWIDLTGLDEEIVTSNFPTIIHIMNFLRKKDGIYYKYIEQPEHLAAIKEQIKENIPSVIISSAQDNVGGTGEPSHGHHHRHHHHHHGHEKHSSNSSNNSTGLGGSIGSSSCSKSSGGGDENNQQQQQVTEGQQQKLQENDSSNALTIENLMEHQNLQDGETPSPLVNDLATVGSDNCSTSSTNSNGRKHRQHRHHHQHRQHRDKVPHYIVANEKPLIERYQLYPERKKRVDAERIFLAPGVYAHYIDELDRAIAQLLDEGNPRDQFKNLDFEAKGGFGSVFAAKIRNPHSNIEKNMVALKKMPHKSPKQKRMNLTEVGFLKYCKHPNIVRYICAYQKNEELWMIMEFMEGGTLREAITNFNFDEARIAYIAREMLKAIEYLHSQQLCHRDLKSSNIMISMSGEIKLIDFGLAIDFTQDTSDIHMCGSPFWMCPEMILGQPHNMSSDIWSFGVCIVEMIKRKVPHHNSRLKAMVSVATTGMVFPRSEYPNWSEEAHSFLEQCLQMDPSKRATAQQLLLHPFLEKACTVKEIKEILPALFMSNTLSKQGLF